MVALPEAFLASFALFGGSPSPRSFISLSLYFQLE